MNDPNIDGSTNVCVCVTSMYHECQYLRLLCSGLIASGWDNVSNVLFISSGASEGFTRPLR